MGSYSSSLIPLETSFFLFFFFIVSFQLDSFGGQALTSCTNAAVDAEAWWDHVLDKDETSLSMSV